MKKWKQKMSVVSLILILALLLSACGGQSNDSAKDKESSTGSDSSTSQSNKSQSDSEKTEKPVKISIWVAGSGDPAYDKAYRTIFDNYVEKHPNVSYELSYIAWSEYFTKLNTGLIGGSGPDVFMTGYGQFGTIKAMDALLPLNDYLPEDWDGYDDFHENILLAGQDDGQQYAMFYPSTRVFMYRKDIAEQAGLTEADMHVKSLEDILTLADKMTVYDDNDMVLISGLEIDPDQEQTVFTFGSMEDKNLKLWNDDLKAAFNTPGVYSAMNKLIEASKSDAIMLQDPGTSGSGLQLGTASMALMADSFYAVLDDAFPGQIGIIKSDMNTLLIGNYMAANKNSPHKDVAADLLIHMFSKESLKISQDVASFYSGRKSLDESYIGMNPEFEKVVHAYERSHLYSTVPNAKYTAAVRELRTSMDAAFQGGGLQQGLDFAEEQWNKVISE
ncbi:extracellular solute-binding protein [Vallitalea pronyensis]|uniref:Extracellular solute-binding protein n=1 Tax=Vallitalea pronyensis TaxID=1348613 RepID=A0A8J8SHT2_9FIRM|nr:extracellular solute-binding protein [Vallitalea pronyensis]QUI23743.1 extracellular solute-binding protein [Vallitalea pronyensis]